VDDSFLSLTTMVSSIAIPPRPKGRDSLSFRGELIMKAIIIGSGLSGLSAGIVLSNQGAEVTLLERNKFYGGYAHCFDEKGYRFETSLHNITKNIEKSFKILGIEKDIYLIPIKSTSTAFCKQTCTVDNFDYTVDSYKQHLKKKYPNESSGIDKFFDYVTKLSPFLNDFSTKRGFQLFLFGVKNITKFVEVGKNIINSLSTKILKTTFSAKSCISELEETTYQQLYFQSLLQCSSSTEQHTLKVVLKVSSMQWQENLNRMAVAWF
jgi:phytoene dehydrogenase-like protein